MIPDDNYVIDEECTITVKGGEIRSISLYYGKAEMKTAYALKDLDRAIFKLEREVERLAVLRELRELLRRGLQT